MRDDVMEANEGHQPLKRLKKRELLKRGFVSGIGWAFGVTIGFVIVSSVLVIMLNKLGGLPVIGDWIADVVETTQEQLLKRTPLTPSEYE